MVRVSAATLAIAPFAWLLAIGIAFVMTPARNAEKYVSTVPLPDNARPTLVRLNVPQYDAWTRLPDGLYGYAYLRRVSDKDVVALDAQHSRLRAWVNYDAAANCFRSSCFKVSFDLDGAVIEDDDKISQWYEGMDELQCTVVNDRVLLRPNHRTN